MVEQSIRVGADVQAPATRVYEIINPSDCVTLETSNELAAVAVALLLGKGCFGLTRDDDESVCPILLFSGVEATEQFIHDTFSISQGETLDPWIAENELDVIECFEFAMYCSMSTRKALAAAFEGMKREEKLARLAKFNDERRSSMNDIGGGAHAYAKRMRDAREARTA